MEKFIKSIFSPSVSEKRQNAKEHSDESKREGDSDHNPIGDRRKLSMSRSGRLKHSNKIRNSLSLELYGKEDELHSGKPKSKEYHVNAPSEPKTESDRKKSVNTMLEDKRKSVDVTATATKTGSKSPEEEIDSAFEIIDKS